MAGQETSICAMSKVGSIKYRTLFHGGIARCCTGVGPHCAGRIAAARLWSREVRYRAMTAPTTPAPARAALPRGVNILRAMGMAVITVVAQHSSQSEFGSMKPCLESPGLWERQSSQVSFDASFLPL